MSVLVSGMHRSGTSMVARLVEAFGLVPGGGNPMPATSDNPRGFFERRDIAELNNQWLDRLGGSWWAPPNVGRGFWGRLDESLLETTRTSYDLFRFDAAAWYSKDPRIALLLPLWDRLALCEHPVILCIRAPSEVATSLRLRNGLTRRRALALWTAYVGSALAHIGNRPALVLDYGMVLNAPAASVAALDAFLRGTGHHPPASWSVAQATALIEAPLRRAIDYGRPAADHTQPPPDDLYQRLLRCHGAGPPDDTSVVMPPWCEEALDELRELYRAQTDRDQARQSAERLAGEVAALRSPLAAAPAATAGETAAAVAALEAERADRQRERDELRDRIAGLDTRLVAAIAEGEALRISLQESERAVEIELERAAAAEVALSEAYAHQSDTLGSAGPPQPAMPLPDTPEMPRQELAQARAENQQRRAALAEMSAELERRRASTYRAEQTVTELTRALARLQKVEVEHRAAHEALLAARFERDNLRVTLTRTLAQQAHAVDALAGVLGSRTWRLGRALASPTLLVRRRPRGRTG